MSVEYRSRKKKPWTLIVAVVAIGGFAAAMGEAWFLKTKAEKEKAEAIEGPPCPTLSAEAFAQRKIPPAKVSHYEDMTFARAAGHISCELKADTYICQFTSPITLGVTVPGKPASYFEPGVGHPATVSVRKGAVACVMASNFRV